MANTDEAKVNPFIPNGVDNAAMGTTVGEGADSPADAMGGGTPDAGARPEDGPGDAQEPDGTDGTDGGGV